MELENVRRSIAALRTVAAGVLAGMLLASPVLEADDTDIYLTTGETTSGESLVMFSLDWRPNLTSTVCQDGECQGLIDEGFLTPVNPDDISFFELLRAALKKALSIVSGVKVGFMMNHAHRNNCAGPLQTGCSGGGYILSGVKDVDIDTELAEFNAVLDSIPIPQGNASHTYQGKELFFELFRFLTGQGVYNGHNGWTDYGSDDDFNLDDPEDLAATKGSGGSTVNVQTPPWDAAVESGGNYISPLIGLEECTRLFTVNVLFQVSQQDADSDTDIVRSKAAGGMGGIDLSGNNNDFSTVVEYLNDVDLADGSFNSSVVLDGTQNVTSYFLVDPSKVNTTTNRYANAGGTSSAIPLSQDPDELVQTLLDIFQQILSISTTFAAPSVPVNVFNRAQTLADVYIALFQANDNGLPQWTGNLKKLKVGDDGSGTAILVDVNGDPAVAIDGRIRHTALTYWTHPGELSEPGPDDEFVSGKDGRTVERGASGSVIPGVRPLTGNTPGELNPIGDTTETSTRKAFTEPELITNGGSNALIPFEATATTATSLLANDDELYERVAGCSGCDYGGDLTSNPTRAAAALAEMEDLIRFARGIDVTDEDNDSDTTDVRPWLFADSLHSRPLPLNYGAINGFSESNPDLRVFMGANDGYMRMFRVTDTDGVEGWAFLPREVMPVLVRLRDNNAGTPVHPYMTDGPTSALVVDNNLDGNIDSTAGDSVYLYFGLRRGGKSYYALDVSDPDNPSQLWRISKDDDPATAGSQGDFTQLAQTWPEARLGTITVDRGSGTESVAAIFVGGGYNGDDDGDDLGDMGKDDRDAVPLIGTDDDEGNAIFIIDAETGELIWKVVHPDDLLLGEDPVNDDRISTHSGLLDSIPSSISLADTDGDGDVDRFYVGDTGGKVWRGDLPAPDRANWTLTPVLSVGRHFSNTNADDRRFFHRVDFVRARDDTGPYDAVVIASGDRAHPIGSAVENWIYVFKDRNITTGVPPATTLTHDDLADLSSNCLQDGDETVCSAQGVDLSELDNGWRVLLDQCEGGATGACGEKGLARPLTLFGTVFVTTFIPPDPSETSTTCGPREGTGLFYALGLDDASAQFNFNTSNDTAGETLERFELLDSPGIPAELVPLGGGDILRGDLQIKHIAGSAGARTFWYDADL